MVVTGKSSISGRLHREYKTAVLRWRGKWGRHESFMSHLGGRDATQNILEILCSIDIISSELWLVKKTQHICWRISCLASQLACLLFSFSVMILVVFDSFWRANGIIISFSTYPHASYCGIGFITFTIGLMATSQCRSIFNPGRVIGIIGSGVNSG